MNTAASGLNEVDLLFSFVSWLCFVWFSKDNALFTGNFSVSNGTSHSFSSVLADFVLFLSFFGFGATVVFSVNSAAKSSSATLFFCSANFAHSASLVLIE